MPGALLLSVIDLKRKQLRNERVKKEYLRDLSNPLDMTETFFISFNRSNKRAYQMILDAIGPHLPKCSFRKYSACSSTEIFSSRIVPRRYSERCKLKHGAFILLQDYVDRIAAIRRKVGAAP